MTSVLFIAQKCVPQHVLHSIRRIEPPRPEARRANLPAKFKAQFGLGCFDIELKWFDWV